MKVKLLEPVPGYEEIAEVRVPMKGDHYFNPHIREVTVANSDHSKSMDSRQVVLTPVKQWRAATLEDGIRAIRGETIVARFRNWSTEDWHDGELATVWPEPGETRWGKRGSCSWLFCEVLDD